MEKNRFEGWEIMGENLRNKVKYCGNNVRLYPLCKMIHPWNAELDDNCQICDYAFIDAGESLKIGKFSSISWFCVIEGGARVCIGDRVFLGPGSKVLSSTYELNGYYAIEHIPDECRATRYGDIIIHDDAYIGANAIVMPGVTIGEGAVVGANTFVDRNLRPWGIYFGTPCKLIGVREKPTEERRKIIEAMDWTKHF